MSIIKESLRKRFKTLKDINNQDWDYIIIGAGITGAQLFKVLSSSGKRTLLIDKGHYASGSSSNSGMLIWGGLLYLKSLDFISVFKFSRSRDNLIQNEPFSVEKLNVKYLKNTRDYLSLFGVWAYWFFSLFQRKRPMTFSTFQESKVLNKTYDKNISFEEAVIKSSDSRYCLDIIFTTLDQYNQSCALNYSEVVAGEFKDNFWEIKIKDHILGNVYQIKSKYLINCAGILNNKVSEKFNIKPSPFRHLWSKGVYLLLKKEESLKSMLIFDDPEKNDVLTYCPSHNIAFWGPTEDNIDNKRELAHYPTQRDISQLALKYKAIFNKDLKRNQIVSYRVGVRPLCVPSHMKSDKYTLSISRNSKIYYDKKKKYLAVYGGKFTGSLELALKVGKKLKIKNKESKKPIIPLWEKVDDIQFVTPEYAIKNEHCFFFRDYIRYHTFIFHSSPNGGLGLRFEKIDDLKKLSSIFLEIDDFDESKFSCFVKEQQDIDKLLKEALYE